MVAPLARRQRRATRQRAPDAARRSLRPPGPCLRAGARHSGDRLQGRGPQASDRRGVPRRARGTDGRVPGPGGSGAGDGVEGQPLRRGGDPSSREDQAVRQPLLVSHHGPDVGACDDQDERPPAVRRSGDPQRPRVRRLRRAESRPWLRQGGQLLHSGQRTRAPGSDRRHLVPARDDRAPEPGDRPVDLHRVLVLRARPRRAASTAASSTTTRSTRSSTAATCCSPPAR